MLRSALSRAAPFYMLTCRKTPACVCVCVTHRWAVDLLSSPMHPLSAGMNLFACTCVCVCYPSSYVRVFKTLWSLGLLHRLLRSIARNIICDLICSRGVCTRSAGSILFLQRWKVEYTRGLLYILHSICGGLIEGQQHIKKEFVEFYHCLLLFYLESILRNLQLKFPNNPPGGAQQNED